MSFHLLPLEQYKLGDTLAVNDVGVLASLLQNLDLPRPDEPEIKMFSNCGHCLHILKNFLFDTSDGNCQ